MTTRPTVRNYLRCVLDVPELPEGFHRDEATLEALVDTKVRLRHIASVADVSRVAIYRQLRKYEIEPPHRTSINAHPGAHGHLKKLFDADPDEVGGPTSEGTIAGGPTTERASVATKREFR